jgi:signal transduction histidine kinase
VHKPTEASATPIGFTLRVVLHPLSQDIEHQLLRIGQEALVNALRRTNVIEIRVTLTCDDAHIGLIVAMASM